MQGKYQPLQAFLSCCSQDQVTLSFDALGQLLGAPLPSTAHTDPAWWTNNPEGRSHAVWLNAGWRTERLDLAQGQVDFVRVNTQHAPHGKSSLAKLVQEMSGTVTILDPDLTRPIDVRWAAQENCGILQSLRMHWQQWTAPLRKG